MNLEIIIPETWNPDNKNAFNSWINKVTKEVIKQKFKSNGKIKKLPQ